MPINTSTYTALDMNTYSCPHLVRTLAHVPFVFEHNVTTTVTFTFVVIPGATHPRLPRYKFPKTGFRPPTSCHPDTQQFTHNTLIFLMIMSLAWQYDLAFFDQVSQSLFVRCFTDTERTPLCRYIWPADWHLEIPHDTPEQTGPLEPAWLVWRTPSWLWQSIPHLRHSAPSPLLRTPSALLPPTK